MITKEQLLKFIEIRNQSSFSSNMQFVFDAEEAGFYAGDLGSAEEMEPKKYVWETEYGQLIEEVGRLRLEECHGHGDERSGNS